MPVSREVDPLSRGDTPDCMESEPDLTEYEERRNVELFAGRLPFYDAPTVRRLTGASLNGSKRR